MKTQDYDFGFGVGLLIAGIGNFYTLFMSWIATADYDFFKAASFVFLAIGILYMWKGRKNKK